MQRYSHDVCVFIRTSKNDSKQISETKRGKHAANLIEGDTDQLRNIKKWKSSKINSNT